MQIVIEIDEKLYERISYLEPRSSTILDRLLRAVQKGTPLPKNHGRLIDADELRKQSYMVPNGSYANDVVGVDDLDDAPTIIEEVKADDSN